MIAHSLLPIPSRPIIVRFSTIQVVQVVRLISFCREVTTVTLSLEMFIVLFMYFIYFINLPQQLERKHTHTIFSSVDYQLSTIKTVHAIYLCFFLFLSFISQVIFIVYFLYILTNLWWVKLIRGMPLMCVHNRRTYKNNAIFTSTQQ